MGGIPDIKAAILAATTLKDKLSAITSTLGKFSGFFDLIKALETNIDADNIRDRIEEVENAAASTMQVFGSGREHILAIKANLVDSVGEVRSLGKGFDHIAKTQNEIADALGRNLIVNSNIYEDLTATEMVTGQGAKELTTAFKDVGFSISHISDEMKTVVDTSRSLGLNAKAVSREVISNIEAMNKYNFQGGVEGMAKMAAQATNLRISMKDTLMFAERVYNPEGAIEMASALQRLGVTQSDLLDPLRLMDLSLNDPTELQNQLVGMTKEFTRLNEAGNFEILPEGKLRLRELESATKISYENLTKMALASADLDQKMQKIRFPSGSEFADDTTRQMIANLAEFDKKSGQYKVSFTTKDEEGNLQAVTKNVEDLTGDDIDALKKASDPKEMTDLAKQQLDVLTRILNSINSTSSKTGYAFAGSPITEKTLTAQVELFETLTKNIGEQFNIRGMREMFGDVSKDILRYAKTSNEDFLKDALNKITVHFAKVIDNTATEALPKTIKEFEKSTNEFVRLFGKLNFDFSKLGTTITDILLKMPTKIPTPPPSLSKPTGKDVISYPGSGERLLTGEFGEFSLDKRDIIIAGDPKKLISEDNENIEYNNSVENFFRKEETFNTKNYTQTIKNEGEFKIALDINVNTNNSSITSDQMERILEDKGIIASIRNKIDELSTNIGRTSPRNTIEYNKNIINQQYNSELS